MLQLHTLDQSTASGQVKHVLLYMDNKETDQPAISHSMSRAVVVCFLGRLRALSISSMILILASLCSIAGLFENMLGAKTKDRVSHANDLDRRFSAIVFYLPLLKF